MLLQAMFKSPFGAAREMDRLFDSMMSQRLAAVPTLRSQAGFPPINMWEDEDNLYAEAELPGLSMDDIEVYATDEELSLKGSRNANGPEGAHALRRERAVGTFSRSIPLPLPIDADRVEAKLTNGVLTITLPKSEQVKPRRIAVTSKSSD